ncbi:MAG: hypothetical protein J0M12_11770 [Deltaproteobacteria bacterium]|nr:hypothetical protein [Deltaproteobacteria bacterium]
MKALRMAQLLSVVLALLSVAGCSNSKDEQQAAYKRRCQQLDSECRPGCGDQKFFTCYVDTKQFPTGPYSMSDNCYATHVGRMCAPCTHVFAVSFGGAFPTVSCEEFLAALDRKNAQCDNCLSKFGESPFAF